MRFKKTAAVLAGLMATGLLAAVPLTSGTASAAAAAPAAITDWAPCADPYLKAAGADCGTLDVPLDPADPTGPTITLAVSRVLHTQEPYQGVVFTNPGGPGGSGTALAAYGQYVPDGAGLHYDWYGVDPRGVGASTPALSCQGGYFGFDRPDYTPSTHKLMRFWRAKTAKYARECGSSAAKELLPHLTTRDNAADFDALRAAIGADKITFYGFSYGTYLAQVYATLYPERVQALILDGVVDPTRVFYRSNLDQDRAFQITFDKFLGWIAKYPKVYHLGSTRKAVHRHYDALRARLTTKPAGGKIGPSELEDVMLPAAYYNLEYERVAAAFSGLVHHRGVSKAVKIYRDYNPAGPGADNGNAIYLATSCTDAPWPKKWSTWVDDNDRVARKAPFLTWGNAWFNAPCRTWPAAARTPVDVSGAGLTAPVLLTSETYDPATPISGAREVRRLFPSAALVEGKGGTSHAVTLYGVACTDDAIAQVLEDGTLPTRKAGNVSDKVCPPLPAPDPTKKSRQAPSLRPLPAVR